MFTSIFVLISTRSPVFTPMGVWSMRTGFGQFEAVFSVSARDEIDGPFVCVLPVLFFLFRLFENSVPKFTSR